jgi:hypothetical protein
MHLAKLRYLDDPPAGDELTLATLLEPPHAVASRARPAARMIAAAVRIAASVAAAPVLALKTARSSASAQDRAAILRL